MPLSTKQVDKDHTPHLFYLPRDTGELDGEGNPIVAYDIPHLEEVYASGKGMRRRAKTKSDALMCLLIKPLMHIF